MYIYTYTHTHIQGWIYKKQKVICHFCEIATYFGKAIRNCESLFVIYSHFCIIYIK